MKVLKYTLIVLCMLVMLSLLAFYINGKVNERVFLTEYTFTHKELPPSFEGYEIMVISDLHEAPFSELILSHIKRESPDMIVFTGDMVQLPDTSISETLKIAEGTENIPMYAISGNHDRQCGAYDEIIKSLWDAGITPLDNDSVAIWRGSESFLLLGAKDPKHDIVSDEKIAEMKEQIRSEFPDGPCFSVMLLHRADLYPHLKDEGVDLILSGHMHGGIARLPFVGGLIGQEGKVTFPEYEYGFFREGESSAMIVSGGCDKNLRKKRYFNPPEVVLVTLEGEE